MVVVGGKTEIKGLREAALLLDSHGALHQDLVVTSVEIRQAPALLQLLASATETMDWTLDRDRKLRHLARVSCEADVLLEVVFPILKADPQSAAAGRLLNRYGWSLRKLARKVDGVEGPFFTLAKKQSNFLRRHATYLHEGTKGLPWLVNNIDEMVNRVADLKRTVVSIPKPKADVDDDGKDDDGGEDDGEEEASDDEAGDFGK